MTIQRDALLGALNSLPDVGSMPAGASRMLAGHGADLVASLTEKLEATAPGDSVSALAVLPEFEATSAWSERAFLSAMILAKARRQAKTKTSRRKGFEHRGAQEIDANLVLKGDLKMAPGSALVIAGDLSIKEEGRLIMGEGARLIVLGDVHIENDWLDETTWSSACVTGSLHIQCALFTCGDLHVGRDLASPFIHAAYSSSALKVLGGISAKMLIDDEHKGSAVFGESDVAFAIVEELKGIEVPDDDVNLQNLRDVLLFPEIAVPETADLFEMTEKIIEMVEERKPIFSGDAPGWIFGARA